MGRWAVFTAHHGTNGAAVPRTFGPDGRPLRRPWRTRSPAAIAAARAVRAARIDRPWPKVLGLACIAVAVVAATNRAEPLARHVPVSAASRPEPEARVRRAEPPTAVAPRGELPSTGDAPCFEWSAGASAPPFTFVLLDAGYREIARADGIDGTRFPAPAHVRARLEHGATLHWFVAAGEGRNAVRSALETFVVR